LSGRLQNAGLLELQSSGAGAAALNLSGNVSFQGGGTVRLSGPANQVVFANDLDPDTLRARSAIFGTGVLTNQNHTIEGSGSLGFFDLGIKNLAGGVIDANQAGAALVIAGRDPLTPTGSGATNFGTFRASDGGILRLFFGTYTQTDGGTNNGTTEALAGSTVQIENSTVEFRGGRLRTVDDGQLLVRQANVTLTNTALENAGTMRVVPGGSNPSSLTMLNGSISNNGAIQVENGFLSLTGTSIGNSGQIALASAGAGAAGMNLNGNVVMSGGGTLTMSGPATEVVFANDVDPDTLRARTAIFGTGVLTNQNHTIRGSGSLGFFDLGIKNLAGGVIDANQAGAALVIAGRDPLTPTGSGATNFGTFRASDGGILRLFFGTYTQTDGGANSGTTEALAGSTVQIENSTVEFRGGRLRSVDDGQLLFRQANVTLTNTVVENAGTLRVVPGTSNPSSLTMFNGSISNSGTIQAQNGFLSLTNTGIGNSGQVTLESVGAGAAGMNLNGNVVMSGGGTLTMSGPATQIVFAGDADPDTMRSRSAIFGTGVLTNQNHTIQGSGSLGFFDLGIKNLAGGVIDANQAGAALVIAGRDPLTPTGAGATNFGTFRASDGGILRLFFGTYTQTDGGANNGTTEALAGSTVQVENSTVELRGGRLRTVGDGQVLVRQAVVTLNNVAVDNAGSMTLIGSSASFNGGTVQNGGTIEAKSGSSMLMTSTSVTGGTFKVSTDSLLTTAGASRLDGVAVQGNIGNVGALTIGADGLAVTGTYLQGTGRTIMQGGQLQAGLIDIRGGSLRGNGTLAGPASINGTVQAGNSAGILNFLGDTSFDGTIEVELAGLLVDGAVPLLDAINLGIDPLLTEFDQYNVFADALLADGLHLAIMLLDGFLPTIGNFFDVLTADHLLVDLGQLVFDLPSLGNGASFAASIVSFDGRDALRLTVVAAAVPEPGTLGCLLFAALAIAAQRLRVRPAG
jgi:hypothetical protein